MLVIVVHQFKKNFHSFDVVVILYYFFSIPQLHAVWRFQVLLGSQRHPPLSPFSLPPNLQTYDNL